MKVQIAQVWVIDDDEGMRMLLSDFLSSQNYAVSTFSRADEAHKYLKQMTGDYSAVDLIISDIRMPGMSGLEFLDEMLSQNFSVPIVLMTAFGSIESAIDAMKKGAYDYIVKPLKLAELRVIAERALELRRLRRDNKIMRDHFKTQRSCVGIVGKSKKMQDVFATIERVAQTSANVLITGESGTGKEMVARALHEAGTRANKPFVAINCAAIPELLLESELFGHEKGAFTGALHQKIGLLESANGGTVFLDEIGDMNADLQAKLLRVIQERKVRPVGNNKLHDIDVRIIAATHKNLKNEIENGKFREDLFYRLSVIPLHLPPLRERDDDILVLADFFMKKYSAMHNIFKSGFSVDAIQSLYEHPWRGNVRELENALERAVILGKGHCIEKCDLPALEENAFGGFFASIKNNLPSLAEVEKEYINFVIARSGGSKEKAAKILGINRRTLYRKDIEAESNEK